MRIRFVCYFSAFLFFSCHSKKQEVVVLQEEELIADLSSLGKLKLSEYGFFTGDLKDLSPAEGVMPYTLNASLFTDYAFKKRFVKFPKGARVTYNSEEVLDFPEGTILIKNFYYPADFRNPNDRLKILETRLLLNEAGVWKALPYIWNEEQTDAFLNVAGKNLDVSWIHHDGKQRTIKYSAPNVNQCKGCHLKGDAVMPIGPSARQLNGDFKYPEGEDNQLSHWQKSGLIKELPTWSQLPKLVSYDDDHAPIDKRARAWLEINCAHCHRVDGPAKNSGLYLLANEKDVTRLGVGKAPVAAGKGSGGLLYDIVAGKPDESILQFRIESVHPGIMMPELGRSTVHQEGVELIRKWISEMKNN